jgi:hypothetical protein
MSEPLRADGPLMGVLVRDSYRKHGVGGHCEHGPSARRSAAAPVLVELGQPFAYLERLVPRPVVPCAANPVRASERRPGSGTPVH